MAKMKITASFTSSDEAETALHRFKQEPSIAHLQVMLTTNTGDPYSYGAHIARLKKLFLWCITITAGICAAMSYEVVIASYRIVSAENAILAILSGLTVGAAGGLLIAGLFDVIFAGRLEEGKEQKHIYILSTQADGPEDSKKALRVLKQIPNCEVLAEVLPVPEDRASNMEALNERIHA